jgi:hypothetical protein
MVDGRSARRDRERGLAGEPGPLYRGRRGGDSDATAKARSSCPPAAQTFTSDDAEARGSAWIRNQLTTTKCAVGYAAMVRATGALDRIRSTIATTSPG